MAKDSKLFQKCPKSLVGGGGGQSGYKRRIKVIVKIPKKVLSEGGGGAGRSWCGMGSE